MVTNVFYIGANLIALVALYNIELLQRKEFYQRFLLSEKQQEIEHANKSLEAQVEKRTKLLNIRNKKLTQEVKIRKEIEEMLFQAKEKAEESDRLKSAFLSNMSHEIRTPMNGILGFIELLQDPDISKEDQKRFFEVVIKSSERLLFTINDIIEISKIEAKQTPINYSQINVNDILKYHYNFFKPEAESKGLQLNISSYLNEVFVETDKNKLESILTNLIKNALKFTITGSIDIGCDFKENKIYFFVKDTGIGISPERINNIFNRFEQADLGISRGYEGSGLGLSIAKAYCEMLGGNIWVESEKDLGSKFYFTISYTPAKQVQNIPPKEKSFKESTSNKIFVLMAEDDQTSSFLIETILAKENFKLIRVANGEDAVEMCRKDQSINLVLMDIKMPVLDGIEATKQIRRFNPEIPIIALSAYALAGEKEKALEAGCNDYIAKPLKMEELISKIRKFTDS